MAMMRAAATPPKSVTGSTTATTAAATQDDPFLVLLTLSVLSSEAGLDPSHILDEAEAEMDGGQIRDWTKNQARVTPNHLQPRI